MTSLHQIQHEYQASEARSLRRRAQAHRDRPLVYSLDQAIGGAAIAFAVIIFLYALMLILN